jgi:hypothetical protein
MRNDMFKVIVERSRRGALRDRSRRIVRDNASSDLPRRRAAYSAAFFMPTKCGMTSFENRVIERSASSKGMLLKFTWIEAISKPPVSS